MRESICLRHSYDRLREVAKDLGFDAARLLRTHAQDDPILHTSFERLSQAMPNRLGRVCFANIFFCLICFAHELGS